MTFKPEATAHTETTKLHVCFSMSGDEMCYFYFIVKLCAEEILSPVWLEKYVQFIQDCFSYIDFYFFNNISDLHKLYICPNYKS